MAHSVVSLQRTLTVSSTYGGAYSGDGDGGLRDAGGAVGDELAGGERRDAVRLRGGCGGGQHLHAGDSDERDLDADERRDARVAVDDAVLVRGRGGCARHGDGNGQRLVRPGRERDGDGGAGCGVSVCGLEWGRAGGQDERQPADTDDGSGAIRDRALCRYADRRR